MVYRKNRSNFCYPSIQNYTVACSFGGNNNMWLVIVTIINKIVALSLSSNYILMLLILLWIEGLLWIYLLERKGEGYHVIHHEWYFCINYQRSKWSVICISFFTSCISISATSTLFHACLLTISVFYLSASHSQVSSNLSLPLISIYRCLVYVTTRSS